MDKLIITGPSKLSGSVRIARAKNAYLPILAAVLLSDKKVHLKNVPDLQDIKTMIKLLSNLGVTVTKDGDTTTFDASTLNSHEATYDIVKTMRASIFVLGPLLARRKAAKVSLPGGCAIGTRPIDLHLVNLEKLGCEINVHSGYVDATVVKMKATHVTLAFPSVGATENLMMAAVFSDGVTTIENSALEPEIDDLANFINAMGGNVKGIGTRTIVVTGVKELKEATYEAIGDRIEAATYLMAALATKSEIEIKGVNPRHLDFVIETLQTMGAKIVTDDSSIKVFKSELKGCLIDTAPHPGFPTDAQAQMIALCTQVKGASVITENIFENRFMHVPELVRLGADITLKGKSAFIQGGEKLTAAPIMCTDLRASAALIIAALATEGETEIQRVYHLDRGYERLVAKFTELGANIKRVPGNPT
ncbi:MAG: UDP-N-acetylglucosamine 1-carboxyvinyltransferase [Bacteriovorax sp.]|nr:UDP-N-acetylglucosamine 1-carboxyvinyltransferase [Bacteriovorax sp.]